MKKLFIVMFIATAVLATQVFASDTDKVKKCMSNFETSNMGSGAGAACAGVKTDSDVATVVKCAANFSSWDANAQPLAACAGVKN